MVAKASAIVSRALTPKADVGETLEDDSDFQ
jgi:hypothetical protein